MNKPEYRKVLSNFDVSGLELFIDTHDLDWNGSFNSKYNRDLHFKNVCAISFIEEFRILDTLLYKRILSYLPGLFDVLNKNYGSGKIVKMHLSKTFSDSEVIKHTDGGLSYLWSHRIHIPIKTNTSAMIVIEDLNFHIPKGQMTEINNVKKHTTINSGEPRVHLILDYMTYPYIKHYD